MAIKINWQDLLKRFINWQEIVRVYKNGGQIRPETVPPVFDDYLCFTAEESNSTLYLDINSSYSQALEISYDKATWMDYNRNTITLASIWDKVYRRVKSIWWIDEAGGIQFYMTWKIAASGDLTSLINPNWTSILTRNFESLFKDCTSLTTPPKLRATTLVANCYRYMFQWCTSLRVAPELPATETMQSCYQEMFQWCTSLTVAPELPATEVMQSCYQWMFSWCTSLTATPSLPATVIWAYCYQEMFSWCTSLETASMLPATNAVYACYQEMFSWCISLTTIPSLKALHISDYSCWNMFNWCTFIKISETQTWEYQTQYRIPSIWEGSGVSTSLWYMFYNTWWTFTGTPNINQTYYTSNQVI